MKLATAARKVTLRAAVLCVIGLIAPVLLVSTFASSSGGAGLLGYPPELTWTLPVALDLVALIGTVVATAAVQDATRRYAIGLVYVPLGLSWAANAIDHLARMTHTEWGWIVASAILAGAPPVALVAVLHMALKLDRERRAVTPERDAVTEPVMAVVTPVTPVMPQVEAVTPVVTGVVTPVTEDQDDVTPELEELTVTQLREIALAQGVTVRGSKAEIAQRIRDAREHAAVTG